MTIRNKSKDHLRVHGGVELVAPTLTPISDDPLRFWTNHPTENTIVGLHVFAVGESENPGNGRWSGPFFGRAELIAELAPAIQARMTLAAQSTCRNYNQALRKFWRVCDQLEATVTADGRSVERLTSVRDLTHLHEAAMHRVGINNYHFGFILNLANDVRRLLRLGPLMWTVPKEDKPNRQLIPDSHAKALKIGIKRDWERVRRTWERHDAIRQGEEPNTLTEFEKQDAAIARQYTEKNEKLRQNWVHLVRIQKTTGKLLPTAEQLCEGATRKTLSYRGIWLTQLRAIDFPTFEDASIAFHAALMGSGWNPSTLITGIDATLPERIFPHPKNIKQSVLVIDVPQDEAQDKVEDIEVTMQGGKRRAGGRQQFCIGLKKNPDSPPNIVAAYLDRTKALRQQLRQDVMKAQAELARLKAEVAQERVVERQFKRLQTLQQGLRNVWLYVGMKGAIEWIDGKDWSKFGSPKAEGGVSYLDNVIMRINVQRVARGELPIARIVPSDFRDIFARWVHLQTGGNIIAVMFALGHAGLRSTNVYLDNNIFSAENGETVRRFMTHLFEELEQGRVDLTILAQLVRHGPLTLEMQDRLVEYRALTRSGVQAGCADPRHPPAHISPDHIEGKLCGTQRCLRDCPNARFLPESLDGIAMRVEELMVMSDHLPLDTWVKGAFEEELESGEYLLADLYPQDAVDKSRAHWREKIRSRRHVVPGVGLISEQEAA